MRQFSNVLFVVAEDGDPMAALQQAIGLTRQDGATLTLVSSIETLVSAASSGRFHDELAEAFDALRSKRLDALKTLADAVPDGIATVCEVVEGKTYIEAIRRVQLYDHDLIVTQASQDGSGALGRIFVSEEMQLLRKCPCPVLLLRPSEDRSFNRIMATVDFDHEVDETGTRTPSALNADLLDLAASIADRDESHLDVVNIFTVPGEGAMVAGWIPMAPENLSDYAKSCETAAEDRLTQTVGESRDRTNLPIFGTDRVETHLVKGRARSEIPALAERLGSDLVVMGTLGRVGVPGLLIGNTAETILGSIRCSVLALKPKGFESPIRPERSDTSDVLI
ncbi:MAG: universal stress protein [Litorimonas sp.]